MKKWLVFALSTLGVAGLSLGQDNYSQWSHFKNIIVNTKSSGANVSGSVANFPVLVRLASAHADVFAQSKTGGADIRFSNAGGKHLPYQIERWDSAGQAAAIWVLADTVKGNDSALTLRMYWGRSAALDSSNGKAVFDTAKGYEGVWHFSDASVDTAFDATANNLKAAKARSVDSASYPVDTVGVIGSARKFTHSTASNTSGSYGGYYRVLNSATGPVNYAENAVFTASVWVNVNAKGSSRSVLSKGDRHWYIELRESGAQWEFTNYKNTVGYEQTFVPASSTLGAVWQYVTGVRNGAAQSIYVNGVLADSTIEIDAATEARNATFDLSFGRHLSGSDRYMRGKIDEINIASVARNVDWIKLSYETQKAATPAVILGATQTPAPITKLTYLDTAKAADTLVFEVGVAKTYMPSYLGGPVDSFAVTGTNTSLPGGITLNKFTGALSGTATATSNAASRTITAYSSAGNATRTIVRSAITGPLANLAYAPDSAIYVAGLPVLNSPSYTGRAPTGFTITPGLPAGLILNAGNGTISGTPQASLTLTSYTVKATNATDTVSKVIKLTIAAAEDYSSWNQHRQIWLNTASNGANVTATTLKFPVLVRLGGSGDTAIFNQSLAGGADLRFTKAATTNRLPHQIESWNATARTAEIWVLVDTVLGNNYQQSIRMHWGKAGAPNASSGPSVFDTAAGYRGVWHFSDATADTAYDATVNKLTAVRDRSAASASYPTDAVGVIGRSREFGPVGDIAKNSGGFYTVLNSATGPLDFPESGTYTVSAWAYLAEVSSNSRSILSKGNNQYYLELRQSGSQWEFSEFKGGIGWEQTFAPAEFSVAQTWTHLMGVRAGASSTQGLYVNGVLVSTQLDEEASTAARNTTQNMTFGRYPGGSDRYMRGRIDEVNIARVARSAGWAKLSYENQKTAQTLVATTQPSTPPVGISAPNALIAGDLSVTALGNGLLFQIPAGSVRAKAALTDMWGRTVWSEGFKAGANRLAWDGRGSNGQALSSGVYVARITLLNGQNKVLRTLERKIPLTR